MKGRRGSVDPEKAMAAQFNPNTRVPLKQHCLWILSVSGPEECAEFLICRLELGLTDEEGKHRDGISETVLRAMIGVLQFSMQREVHDFRKRLLEATKTHRPKLPPKGKQVVVSQEWEDQKQRIIERDNKRREAVAANRQRVRAAPKPAPIQLHRRRLERSLDATPMEPSANTATDSHKVNTSAMTGELISSDRNDKGRLVASGNACIDLPAGSVDFHHASAVECRSNGDHGEASLGRHLGREHEISASQSPQAKKAKGYSRKAKGELGKRLGSKIDKLLDEIKSQPFSSEDPPAITVGSDERCADEPAADGGISGFPLEPTPTATVWDAFSGRPECSNDTTDFLEQLDAEPRLRSAAMLRSLGRLREELEAMPEQSAFDARVCVSLQDPLVLMTQLMQKLR